MGKSEEYNQSNWNDNIEGNYVREYHDFWTNRIPTRPQAYGNDE